MELAANTFPQTNISQYLFLFHVFPVLNLRTSSRLLTIPFVSLTAFLVVSNQAYTMAAAAAAVIPTLEQRPIKNTIVLFDVDETLTPARRVSSFLIADSNALRLSCRTSRADERRHRRSPLKCSKCSPDCVTKSRSAMSAAATSSSNKNNSASLRYP